MSELSVLLKQNNKHFAVYLDLFHKYIRFGHYSFRELEQEFDAYYQDNLYQYENFFVYWLFLNYMDVLKDKNLFRTVSMMIFEYYIMKILAVLTWLEHDRKLELTDQISIFSDFSQNLEHNPTNYSRLYDILKEKGVASITGLTLLMYS